MRELLQQQPLVSDPLVQGGSDGLLDHCQVSIFSVMLEPPEADWDQLKAQEPLQLFQVSQLVTMSHQEVEVLSFLTIS